MSADRGREVSEELTEVRTVLSRAETALAEITDRSYRGNVVYRRTRYNREARKFTYHEELPPSGEAPDPDVVDMCAALEQCVAALSRWRRTGRPRRSR